jgi:hypothetical protein
MISTWNYLFSYVASQETGTATVVVLQIACCNGGCPCQSCMAKLQSTINYAFNLCGGIGLFFSFTEVR